MKKRKNGFLTFCFSCLPGAGQMFLGFAKEGISLMTAFFGVIALTSLFQIGVIIWLVPIIWFYSFFDAINKNALPEEELNQLEDQYLFFRGIEELQGFPFAKFRGAFAVVLILLGLNLLLRNMLSLLEALGFQLSSTLYYVLFDSIPQLAVALLIIAAGFYLITGKKISLEKEGDNSREHYLMDDSQDNQGGDD